MLGLVVKSKIMTYVYAFICGCMREREGYKHCNEIFLCELYRSSCDIDGALC